MPIIAKPLALHRSVVNLSAQNIQATRSTRLLHTSSALPRLLNPFKSNPDSIPDNNFWPSAIRPAVAKIAKREYNHEDSGTGVPIKISVKKPRPEPKVKQEPECYHIASQVPYEQSDKYSIHRIDPSFVPRQDGLRPTVLRVIVPAETISEAQKNIRPEPCMMQNYPESLENPEPKKLK